MTTTSKWLTGLMVSIATAAGAQELQATAPVTAPTEAPAAAPAAPSASVATVEAKATDSSIVPGYYHDDRKEGGHDLYIKQVGGTYYALIIWKASFISIFRLESVDPTTQAWVQLFQGEDNMLTTEKDHTATYAVTSVRDGKSLSLRFSWTEYAKTLGPNVLCSIQPVFTYKGQQKQWTQFAQLRSTTFKGQRVRKQLPKDPLKRKLEIVLSNAGQADQWNVLADNVILETTNDKAFVNKGAGGREQLASQFVFNGEYRGEEVFPGLLTIRKRELDATSASGIKLNREISLFAASIGGAIQIFTMPPKARDCAYVRNELK